MKTNKKYFLNLKTFLNVIILTKLVKTQEMILIDISCSKQSCKNYLLQKRKNNMLIKIHIWVQDIEIGDKLKYLMKKFKEVKFNTYLDNCKMLGLFY